MYTSIARRAVLSFRLRVKALIVTVLATVLAFLPLIVGGEPAAIAANLNVIFGILCFAIPAICVADVVAGDLRSGIARLWLQKPIDPVVFYLRRFLEALSLAFALTLLALGATRLIVSAVAPGFLSAGQLVDTLPLTLIVGAMGFGFSAWMSRGATIATFAFAFGSLLAGSTLPDLLGRPWSWVADALFIPGAALDDFQSYLAGTTDAVLLPLARLLAHGIAWTAVGALGVWHASTRGGLPAAEQS